MSSPNPSSNRVDEVTRAALEWEKGWTPMSERPPMSDYYRVRDSHGRDGIAFMNRNRTWTLIDGSIEKPLIAWRVIQ